MAVSLITEPKTAHEDHRVYVAFKDLGAHVAATKTPILTKLNGTFGPGLTAIMGPTSAGKTTFLNLLTGLVPPTITTTGERRINGQKYSAHDVHFGYVWQTDDLNGRLTVYETLAYAAQLQLSDFSHEQREERIVSLLKEFGLFHVKDTIVGTPLKKGISGGQRKRVSVCLALLTEPKLIVLDEPTAGLDSVNALRLVESLKERTQRGCTIITVIHQPQRAIYELLDRLVLLRSGEIIYDGEAQKCIPYMTSLGVEYESGNNPADHIMEVISPRLGESRAQLEARCIVKKSFIPPVVDLEVNSGHPLPKPQVLPNAQKQFWILFRRQGQQELRNYSVHLLNLFTTTGCAALIGAVWFQLPLTPKGISKRPAALFFCVVNQSLFGAMKTIIAFPEQRTIMLRERRAKMYSCSPAVQAWFIVELLYTVPWALLFSFVAYFMIGLQKEPGRFFLFALFMFLDKNCASSLAQLICAATGSATLAAVILPMALEMCRLFSGFFLVPKLLPNYFSWLDPLSYVKYAYVGVALNELDHGLHANCLPNCTATPTSGHQIVVNNGLDYITIWGCVLCLICVVLVARFIAYLCLRYLKW
jgi:ATP-binding cassette subfamily G (WHITE) protein 2